MKTLLFRSLILTVLVSIQGKVYADVMIVGEGNAVTITCRLNVEYPTWTGPSGLVNPINNGSKINVPGMMLLNKKDLHINKTMLVHDGNYTCIDVNGNSTTVDVDVQYFQPSASFTTATDENSTTILNCLCYSNPNCKIVPHITTNIRDGQEHHNSVTTFEECKPDPLRENRTKCSVFTVMHVYKEDNGLEMSCTFEYKNATDYLTLYPKVKVLFPPTRVNISAVLVDSKLSVNCSTDSSNPVSSLYWRRGVRTIASMNPVINTDGNIDIMEAEYNGRNISQTIDIDRNDIVIGEQLICCARYLDQELCDSLSLNSFQISGSYVYKYSLSTLFIGMLLFLV